MKRVFEVDDYPIGKRRTLRTLDRFKARFPQFCATVFAIPSMMSRRDWLELWRRDEWVQVAPHGFIHESNDGITPYWHEHKRMLDRITKNKKRWARLWKSPWYSQDSTFIYELTRRGFAIASKSLTGFPFPIGKNIKTWNILDYKAAKCPIPEDCVAAHPYSHRLHRAARNNRYIWRLSPQNVKRLERAWAEVDKPWSFSIDHVRNARILVNLGCGPQQWNGWDGLDKSPSKWGGDIIQWEFGQPLPYSDNRVDLVFSSHIFEHMTHDLLRRVAKEVWRVLRPGAIWRISDNNNHTWRPVGSQTQVGRIRQKPSLELVREVVCGVGFEFIESCPGYTMSPIPSVLDGDGRHRLLKNNRKFYAEAVKAVVVPDLSKPHTMRYPLRYHLPTPAHVQLHRGVPPRTNFVHDNAS